MWTEAAASAVVKMLLDGAVPAMFLSVPQEVVNATAYYEATMADILIGAHLRDLREIGR